MSCTECPHCGHDLNVYVVVSGPVPVKLVEGQPPEVEKYKPPPPAQFGPPRRMRVEEAAHLTGVAVRTYYEHAKAGKKPPVREGRVMSDELHAYLYP